VLPIASWLQQELRPEVSSTFSDRDLCKRAGLRPEAVSALWEAFQAGAPGIYWSRVWSLYVLLWWCRRHEASL
jgi:asparagine synthase (glutamine-hydrolysing)